MRELKRERKKIGGHGGHFGNEKNLMPKRFGIKFGGYYQIN